MIIVPTMPLSKPVIIPRMSSLHDVLNKLEARLQTLVEGPTPDTPPPAAVPSSPGDTAAIPLSTVSAENGLPVHAFLIVGGERTFPLTEAVVNLGRRGDNHLILDDLRVSRSHAQLRAVRGRYVIFDLDSTGGTFVNGQRVTQSTPLFPGDVISLAGVELIFGQDPSGPEDETSPLPSIDSFS